VIAGDISPIDVITHIPILCEDANVPYVYVPNKEELGLSGGCKRPTSVVLISPKSDSELQVKMKEYVIEVNALPKSWIKT